MWDVIQRSSFSTSGATIGSVAVGRGRSRDDALGGYPVTDLFSDQRQLSRPLRRRGMARSRTSCLLTNTNNKRRTGSACLRVPRALPGGYALHEFLFRSIELAGGHVDHQLALLDRCQPDVGVVHRVEHAGSAPGGSRRGRASPQGGSWFRERLPPGRRSSQEARWRCWICPHPWRRRGRSPCPAQSPVAPQSPPGAPAIGKAYVSPGNLFG